MPSTYLKAFFFSYHHHYYHNTATNTTNTTTVTDTITTSAAGGTTTITTIKVSRRRQRATHPHNCINKIFAFCNEIVNIKVEFSQHIDTPAGNFCLTTHHDSLNGSLEEIIR